MLGQAKLQELYQLKSTHERFAKTYSEVLSIKSLNGELIYYEYHASILVAGDMPFVNFT